MRLLLSVLVLLALAAPATVAGADHAPAPPAQARQLFDAANAGFRDALATKDKAESRALLAQSIARWRALTGEAGIRNARLYVNIGNAELLAGDTGRAIAAFRRGERLGANTPGIREGLDAARRQAGYSPPVPTTWSEKALQWAGYLPRRALLGTFALLWIAGWGVLLARMLGLAPARWIAPALLGLGALAASPIVASEILDSRLVHAVVVASKAPAFNGPSDAVYQPTFKDGLPAGVEVRLLEDRSGWSRVRLGDGQETWVRAADLERI